MGGGEGQGVLSKDCEGVVTNVGFLSRSTGIWSERCRACWVTRELEEEHSDPFQM